MSSAAAARRRGRARRVRVRYDLPRMLAGLVALAAASSLVAALVMPLPIREVLVSGVSRLAASDIRTAAALDGRSVFAASAREAERRIAAIPAVRRVRVTVQLPDRALVDLEERRPAIVLSTTAGTLLADDEGVLFAGAIDGLPTLEDDTARRAAGERLDPALVAAARAIASREPAYFGRPIEHIRLTGTYGLIAMIGGPTEIRLGSTDQIDAKLEAARQIVLLRSAKRLDYVDVRNRENPVFFPNN